jgi:hypothetical protein
MVRVRLYQRSDGGTLCPVGFLDIFGKAEAPDPINATPPDLLPVGDCRQIVADLSRRKLVGTAAGYEWRVEYA